MVEPPSLKRLVHRLFFMAVWNVLQVLVVLNVVLTLGWFLGGVVPLLLSIMF